MKGMHPFATPRETRMKLVRAAFFAVAVAAVGFTSAGIDARPAQALCKYGSGQCINPRPNFDYQPPETIYIPEDSWYGFEDCKYYPGSCH